jgi:hypothetical protein
LGYVFLIVSLLGKVLGAVTLALLALFLLALALPVHVRLSGSGSLRGWQDFLEDGFDDSLPSSPGEGQLLGQVSLLGGLIQVSAGGVLGTPGGPGTPGSRTRTRVSVLGLFSFTAGDGKSRARHWVSPSEDAGGPAGQKRKSRKSVGGPPARRRRRRTVGLKKVLKSLAGEDLRGQLVFTLKRLYRVSHVRAGGRLEFGLGDPGSTGMAYGVAESVAGCLGITGLTLAPNFEEDILKAEVSAEAWFIPAAVAFIVIRALLSAPVRRLWWRQRKVVADGAAGLGRV